jgi:hypothetical protein
MPPRKRARKQAAPTPPTVAWRAGTEEAFHATEFHAKAFGDKAEVQSELVAQTPVKVHVNASRSVTFVGLPGAEIVIDQDLAALPEPESTNPLDLFASPSKSVLFAVEEGEIDEMREKVNGEQSEWALYDVTAIFDRVVRLTSVTIKGTSSTPTQLFIEPTAGVSQHGGNLEHRSFQATDTSEYKNMSMPSSFEKQHVVSSMVGSAFRLSECVQRGCHHCSYDGMVVFREKVVINYEEVEGVVGHADLSGLGNDLLSMLYVQTDLHDVTFKCNGTSVTANKAIVAGRCEYFRSMLFGDCRESSSDEIDLLECSENAFRVILHFLYCGGLPSQDDPTVLIDAHKVADMYVLPHCRSLCATKINKKLTVENAVDAAMHAYRHGLSEVKVACVENIVKHRKNVFAKMDVAVEAGKKDDAVSQLVKDVFSRAAAGDFGKGE